MKRDRPNQSIHYTIRSVTRTEETLILLSLCEVVVEMQIYYFV